MGWAGARQTVGLLAPALGLLARALIRLLAVAVLGLLARALLEQGLSAAAVAAGAGGRVDDLVGAAAALAGAALAAWLGLVQLLAALAQLPGVPRRALLAIAVRLTPPVLRRVCCLALGAGLAFGTPASTAWAAVTEGSGRGPTASAPGTLPADPLDRPAAPADGAAQPAASVTVEPGDSLWRIAERALGPNATAAEVARAWPAWWTANRDVIGPRPDLLHPGQRLRPPSGPSNPGEVT